MGQQAGEEDMWGGRQTKPAQQHGGVPQPATPGTPSPPAWVGVTPAPLPKRSWWATEGEGWETGSGGSMRSATASNAVGEASRPSGTGDALRPAKHMEPGCVQGAGDATQTLNKRDAKSLASQKGLIL